MTGSQIRVQTRITAQTCMCVLVAGEKVTDLNSVPTI